jgi:hypothetical protein
MMYHDTLAIMLSLPSEIYTTERPLDQSYHCKYVCQYVYNNWMDKLWHPSYLSLSSERERTEGTPSHIDTMTKTNVSHWYLLALSTITSSCPPHDTNRHIKLAYY